MPRIDDVVRELSLDKDTFAKIYKKILGKPLTASTVTISDANLEKIKEISEKLPSKGEKKVEVKKIPDAKVLKAGELGAGGGGFLSGLGFAKKEEKGTEDDLDLDELLGRKDSVEVKSEDVFSFAGVAMPERRQPRERDQNSSSGYQGKSSSGYQGKSSSNPGYQGNKSKATGNVNIAQGTYKSKDKQQSSSTFFRDQQVSSQRANTTQTHNQTYKKPFDRSRPAPRPAFQPQASKIVKEATTSANLVKKEEVFIEDKITVKEFSEKIGIPLPEIMKKLIENKIMTGVTSSLDFDTASLIADDLGVILKKKDASLDVESFMSGDLQKILDLDKDAITLKERAPVVTVMGHVDHGKTSLLDYLRKTSVADGEAGGITQSIGASVVEYNEKKITFIDTPGHELFTSLRARGAKLTNIAIIVVAADDSVMPQTIESINHAKSAGIPIIIAVTKIDKPGNKMDQIKSDIAQHGLVPEDWGGDTPIVGVSSKTGEGIDLLLEYVLLQAEMLELKYNPERSAVGVILDAHKDPKQGVVTSIIVLTGHLKVGDVIVAYNTYGKIKRMQNWMGKPVQKVFGGEPVQILGFTEMPEAGRMIEVVKNEKDAQNRVSLIQEQEQSRSQSAEGAVQQFLSQLKAGDNKISELRLILKSDGSSSLEALQQAVQGLALPKNVVIKVVHSDVGHFSDGDVSLAQASGALLIGFNISINSVLKKKAEQNKVEIKSFDIIYELTDYLSNLLLGMIEIEKEEVVVGKLDVLAIFFTETREMTIGGKVIDGKVKNKLKFRLFRGEDILCNGEILSLQRNKNEVKEVVAGEECGMKVKVSKKVLEGDILEFYEMQEVKEEKPVN